MATLVDSAYTAAGTATAVNSVSTQDTPTWQLGDAIEACFKGEGAIPSSVSIDTGASTATFTITNALVIHSGNNDLWLATGVWIATSGGTAAIRGVVGGGGTRPYMEIRAIIKRPASGKVWQLGTGSAAPNTAQGTGASPATGSRTFPGAGSSFLGVALYDTRVASNTANYSSPNEFPGASAQAWYRGVPGAETVTPTGAINSSSDYIAQQVYLQEVDPGGVALSGSGVASASGYASLTVRAALIGSGLVSASGLGTLSGGPVLVGSGVARTEGLAALTVRVALVGAGNANAAGLGQLASGISLAGAGVAATQGIGALTVRAALVGTGRVAAVGAATLAVPYRSPDLLGNIPLWRLKARFAAQEPTGAALAGTGIVAAAGVGALSVRAAPAGSGRVDAAGLGALTVRAVLAGAGVAQASGLGALNSGAVLFGNGTAPAAGLGQLTVRVALAGTGSARAEGLGSFAGAGAVLVGSGNARADSQADLQLQRAALSAIASAQASAVAALRVYAALVGTGNVSSSGRGVLLSAGGDAEVPERVFRIVTQSRIFKLATVTRVNEKAEA